MEITKDFVNIMGKPVFVISKDAEILHTNSHGHLLLEKLLHKSEIASAYEIDPDFRQVSKLSHLKKDIWFNNLKISCDIFETGYEGRENGALLYVFDNILFNSEVDSIINSIEYVVNIVNSDGAIESFNRAGYTIIGLTHQDTESGHSIIEHYENKTTMVTEPTFFKVMREKKSIVGRTTYRTGVTLLHKATPVFSQDGEIKRVVIIGQNVSDNAALDEMLILSESRNSVPTIIRFNEINTYFSDKNYLIASESMKKIVNTAIKVAPSDSSVFIWGESGVGKEMVANLIHYSSNRRNGPFVTINCAAIPAELLESEFFGYQPGAFTGANKGGKKGLLEEATGGTVFLDEIGELPYSMQSKLLRAIQEGKIRRVGGNQDIHLDVRYISATNLKIEQILDNTVFRKDLYYRLGVIPINVPPLRHRREDILPLITHFLKQYNLQYGRTTILSKRALNRLINYDWPGNVRELNNTIQRTVLLADQDLIDKIEFDNRSNAGGALLPDADPGVSISIQRIVPVPEAYEEVFSNLVKLAYQKTGSIVQAAALLQINPSTIHRKIKEGKLHL